MSKVRVSRVAEQIKKEIGYIFQTELRDPNIGFTTVTGVELSPDLAQAKVFVSIMGDENQRATTVTAIGRARGFIRTEIGRRIRLRHVPELVFALDTSIDYGTHIERLLRDLQQGGEM